MKKILSIFLILTIIFTANINAFANDVVENVKILTSFDGSKPGATSGKIVRDSTSIVGKDIALSSSGSGTVVSVEDGNGGYYINNSHSYLLSNYRTSLLPYVETHPVLSVKYDINIPSGTNESASRSFRPFITATADGDSNTKASPTNLTIDYADGNFSANVSIDCFDTTVHQTVNYAPGSWTTVEFRAYYGNDGKLICGAYVGETQIFYGEGKVDYSTAYALNNYYFVQDTGISTYMDNITVSVMGSENKPVDSITQLPSIAKITHFDGKLLKDESDNVYAESDIPLTNGARFYPGSDSEFLKPFIVRNGFYGNGVSSAVENENTYFVVNWSDVQNNYRSDLKTYLTENLPILSVAYDMRIPVLSADKTRQTAIMFSSDPTSGKLNKSYIYINYDGEISVSTSTNIVEVVSKSSPYTPGNWANVEIRTYLTAENKINIGVYVGGKQIYYGEGSADYSEGFGIHQMNFCTETETSGENTITFDTHYDNIIVSALKADYKPKEMLSLTLSNDEENNKVDSKVVITADYTTLCLVTAIYNNSGSMEKLWIDTTIENGVLSTEISGAEYSEYVKSGYKVKAFVFDTLQSAIPQIESKSLTIN